MTAFGDVEEYPISRFQGGNAGLDPWGHKIKITLTRPISTSQPACSWLCCQGRALELRLSPAGTDPYPNDLLPYPMDLLGADRSQVLGTVTAGRSARAERLRSAFNGYNRGSAIAGGLARQAGS
jgi:hypothetical protein